MVEEGREWDAHQKTRVHRRLARKDKPISTGGPGPSTRSKDSVDDTEIDSLAFLLTK